LYALQSCRVFCLMFVMLLLPKVIQMKKDNQDTLPILLKYVGYIAVLSSLIVVLQHFLPEFVVMSCLKRICFNFLLWKYALANLCFLR
jgi:hypothetical protein